MTTTDILTKPSNGSIKCASTLVLGIGNILLRDEGVGVRAIEKFRFLNFGNDVEYVNGGTNGFGLIDVIANRQKLIVIDAADIDGSPGTMKSISFEELQHSSDCLSFHEFGLAETIKATKLLGCAPAEIVTIGIKPHDTKPGLTLSKPVNAALPELLLMLLSELG